MSRISRCGRAFSFSGLGYMVPVIPAQAGIHIVLPPPVIPAQAGIHVVLPPPSSFPRRRESMWSCHLPSFPRRRESMPPPVSAGGRSAIVVLPREDCYRPRSCRFPLSRERRDPFNPTRKMKRPCDAGVSAEPIMRFLPDPSNLSRRSVL